MLAKQTDPPGRPILVVFFVGVVLGGLLCVGWRGLAEPPRSPESAVPVSSAPRVERPAARTALGLAGEGIEAPAGARTVAASNGTSAVELGFGLMGMGLVHDIDGIPIKDARVTLELEDGRKVEASTSGSGAWSLLDLQPGPAHIELSAESFVAVHEDVVLPAARTWRWSKTMLRGLQLPVRFVDPGGELVEVAGLGFDVRGVSSRRLGVAALSKRPGRFVYGVNGGRAAWSELGHYVPASEFGAALNLGPDYQGLLRVDARPPLWVALTYGGLVLQARRLLVPPEELVFEVDLDALGQRLGDLTVAVVSEDGEPLTVETPGDYRSPGVEYMDGKMIVRAVPPGRRMFRFGGRVYESLRVPYFMPVDADLDLGTFVVRRMTPLELHVVDEQGAPLATDVLATRFKGTVAPWQQVFERGFRSNEEGRATLPGLAAGATLVQLGGRDGRARVAHVVDASAGAPIELVVPRGVAVRFERGTGLLPGVRCSLMDECGRTLYADYWLPDRLLLAPGAYSVRIGTQDGEVDRIDFSVKEPGLVVHYGEAS
jgi:hypothetical protein